MFGAFFNLDLQILVFFLISVPILFLFLVILIPLFKTSPQFSLDRRILCQDEALFLAIFSRLYLRLHVGRKVNISISYSQISNQFQSLSD